MVPLVKRKYDFKPSLFSLFLPAQGTDLSTVPNRNMESTNKGNDINSGIVVKLLPVEEKIFSTIVQLLDLVSPDRKIEARYVGKYKMHCTVRLYDKFFRIELLIIFYLGWLADGLETR